MKKQYKSLNFSRYMLNGFSIGMLIVLLFILSWGVYDKHNSFIENKKIVSEAAVANVRDAIGGAVNANKRILDYFVVNNQSAIFDLIQHPHEKQYFDFLFKRLKKLLPSLFTINVYRENVGLLTGYNDFVGRICKIDLEDYMAVGFHEKRTHPSPVIYHYDEISSLEFENSRYLFFASFSLDTLVNILDYSTPEGHNLMVVNDSDDGFIEINREGVRDLKDSMKHPTIKSLDSPLILSDMPVPDTHWHVIDIQDIKLNQLNLYSYIFPVSFIYLLVTFIVLFMRRELNKSFVLLNTLNDRLMSQNKAITDLNADLENLTITDALTGLYNRRYFDMQLEREWNRTCRDKLPFYLIMIDIDYFKKYNDHYGHPEGDKCLKEVAEILASSFARSNEFVARYGGEEFVAIISGRETDCEALAEGLHKKLAEKKLVHDTSDYGQITVSIGIAAHISGKVCNRFLVVKKADEALYQAKQQGRNQTCTVEI